jgi:outer membrane protein
MRKFLIILSLTCFLFSMSAFSQKMSIGVVDVEKIGKELDEYKEADAKIKEMQKKVYDSLMAMQDEYGKKIEAYQRQKGMMKPEEQAKQEEILKNFEQTAIRFRDEKNQELQQKGSQLLEPIKNKIKEAIAQVAKDNNLDLIIDKNTNVGIVVFNSDKVDYTQEVIIKLKKGK